MKIRNLYRFGLVWLVLFVCGCNSVKNNVDFAESAPCCALSDESIESPRDFISDNLTTFAKNSEWEGVWGEFSQCNPLSKIGWCYKQSGLNIYDCRQTNEYRYEEYSAVCKLGAVIKQIPDPAQPNEHLICDTTSYPGVIEIRIDGNNAKPSESYFEMMCGGLSEAKKATCRKNVSFSLTKSEQGIRFFSSKGLDSIVCETPADEKQAGSLNALYPPFKASFDCAKNGLSKIERGICNSFYTLREDYSLNVMFEYAMHFVADNKQQAVLKNEQLEWIKKRNIQCNQAESAEKLFACLYGETSKRIEELSKIIERSQSAKIELISSIEAVKIYESPSLKSSVLYTKILNEGEKDYSAILADTKSHNGFIKIVLIELSPELNPNNNAIVGYVQNTNVRKDKRQANALD